MQNHPDPDKYLEECLKIEPLAIEEEFIRVPADLAFWNDRYASVYQHFHEMKLAREQLYHHLYKQFGDDMLTRQVKKPTIVEITAAVETDPEFLIARTAEITADAERVRLYGIMDSLRSKRDMLISLGAHIRALMNQDPMIKQQASVDREVATP